MLEERDEDGQSDGRRYRLLPSSQLTILVSLDVFSHVRVVPCFFFSIPREVDIFSIVISSPFQKCLSHTSIYIASVSYIFLFSYISSFIYSTGYISFLPSVCLCFLCLTSCFQLNLVQASQAEWLLFFGSNLPSPSSSVSPGSQGSGRPLLLPVFVCPS